MKFKEGDRVRLTNSKFVSEAYSYLIGDIGTITVANVATSCDTRCNPCSNEGYYVDYEEEQLHLCDKDLLEYPESKPIKIGICSRSFK